MLMIPMSKYPNSDMIRRAEMGSHLNDYRPVDEMSKKFLMDDFDATIEYFNKKGDYQRAAFLTDEKKRYEDNTD